MISRTNGHVFVRTEKDKLICNIVFVFDWPRLC